MKKTFFSIGWKISIYIILITCVLSSIIMTMQYFTSYRYELERVEANKKEIQASHVPVLIASLWNFDSDTLQTQLKGMLALRHVVYTKLETHVENYTFGEDSGQGEIYREVYTLTRDNGEVLGTLYMHYSDESIRRAAFNQLKVVFMPVCLQILLITLAVIIIYHINITRHLRKLGDYTQRLTTDNLQKKFTFNRKNPGKTIDELDQLLESIDYMRINMIRQLDQQQTMEKQIQQHKKMDALGTLAGGVAHDLNNILTGVVSYPELLMTEVEEGSTMWKSLKKIRNSGARASVIVQDLLTLARRAVPQMEVLELTRIVHNYLESPEFDQLQQIHSNVQFTLDLEQSKEKIWGSEAHITKALMNLVTNAAEAIEEEGVVTISTKKSPLPASSNRSREEKNSEYLAISVSDTGSGIREQDVDRIFEPFYTRKVMGRSGSGLGMTVVYGTIQDHNGEIDISTQLGQGTTITLYFPITEEEASLELNQSINHYIGNGELILIVDDELEQRELASQILHKLRYRTETARSGEEALVKLQENSFDLIMLDMLMNPGMDGLSTFLQIKANRPQQKVILVSGFSETDRVREALKHGAKRYISKPYFIETIGAAIKSELQG